MTTQGRDQEPRTPTIGFFAARLDEAFQNSVWRGAVSEAQKLGYVIVFYGGQRLNSPIGYEALDNVAFDLAERGRLSGAIIMTNVIGSFLSHEKLLDFIGRFEDKVPVVSIGIGFPDIPSVSVNDKGNIRALVEHLVKTHGRKRFIYITGPRYHTESEARLAEFLSSLSEFLPGGEAPRIVYGDFTENTGYSETLNHVDPKKCPDAIMCANDHMAFGAMRALEEMGIEVPREVSVTGYDDTENCRFSIPPLTTVHQPTFELGIKSVNHIAALFGDLPEAPSDSGLKASVVIRESCGCPFNPEPKRVTSPTYSADVDEESLLAELSREVNRELRQGKNPANLRARILAPIFNKPSLSDRARLIISASETRFQAGQRVIAERRASILRSMESTLLSNFDIKELLQEVARGTKLLGISACWLTLFDPGDGLPTWSRLILASEGDEQRILAPEGQRFQTWEVIPGGLPDKWTAYVIEPLRFSGDLLGYLVCTADSSDTLVYFALRDQLSTALKGASLMAAVRDREQNLERDVNDRNIELSMTNARLVAEIAQRELLERDLLKVSNHIMGKIGRDIHDNVCQDIASIGIQAAILEGALRRAGSASAETAKELVRMSGAAAANAKQIARGLYPADLGERGIVSAVEALVRSAKARSQAEILVEFAGGFTIDDPERALQLYRITQEALNNAVNHAKANRIIVRLERVGSNVIVQVKDDGTGILEKRNNGTGMGLQILKYRASVIDANLEIRTGPDGTTVTCEAGD